MVSINNNQYLLCGSHKGVLYVVEDVLKNNLRNKMTLQNLFIQQNDNDSDED